MSEEEAKKEEPQQSGGFGFKKTLPDPVADGSIEVKFIMKYLYLILYKDQSFCC